MSVKFKFNQPYIINFYHVRLTKKYGAREKKSIVITEFNVNSSIRTTLLFVSVSQRKRDMGSFCHLNMRHWLLSVADCMKHHDKLFTIYYGTIHIQKLRFCLFSCKVKVLLDVVNLIR